MHEELWREYSANRSIVNRNRLVEANLPLVHHVIHRRFSNHPWYEELYQVGIIGLIGAIERFDPAFETRFGSYAYGSIQSAIGHFLRDKRHMIKPIRNKNPYLVHSLNSLVKSTDDGWDEWIDIIPVEKVRSGEFDLSAEMLTEIERLPAEWQQAIDLYYFQALTRKQIAESMCVTPTTVSRYLMKGLEQLRGSLSGA
jgi:RNA polymerase sigma factor (sigma-70 family)